MNEIIFSPSFFWLLLAIVLFVIEVATVNLFTIWMGFGALGAMLAAYAGANSGVQVVIFLLISGILLFFTRPLALKYIKKTPTNTDRFIGRQFLVKETIDNTLGTGTVKADGLDWTARSADGSVIPEGSMVKAVQIEGVKMIVTPVGHE